jgi:fucose 4-O-acetylase-like acetyltransferase
MRINFIDVAKGLGIIMVVLFHIPYCSKLPFSGIITMFYMPLFFLMSGLFFKPINRQGFIKKIRSLLIPYFSFYVICFLIFSIHFMIIGKDPHLIYFFAFIVGATESPTCLPMWFLLSLFEMFLIVTLIVKIKQKIYILLIAFFLGVCGYLLGKEPNLLVNIIPLLNYNINANYYSIATTLLCLPFFIFGYVYKKYFLQKNYYLGVVMFVFSLILHYYNNKPVVISQCFVQMNIIIFYLSSISMIYAFIQLCRFIQNIKLIEYVLTYYGKNSIIVLCFHIPMVPLYHYIFRLFQHQELSIFITLLVIMVIEVGVIEIVNRKLPFMIGKNLHKQVFSR